MLAVAPLYVVYIIVMAYEFDMICLKQSFQPYFNCMHGLFVYAIEAKLLHERLTSRVLVSYSRVGFVNDVSTYSYNFFPGTILVTLVMLCLMIWSVIWRFDKNCIKQVFLVIQLYVKFWVCTCLYKIADEKLRTKNNIYTLLIHIIEKRNNFAKQEGCFVWTMNQDSGKLILYELIFQAQTNWPVTIHQMLFSFVDTTIC